MELRHLRYFVAVATELNFRRAAVQLHISQPTLSAQIKDLEYELNAQLLSRTTGGVRLTAAGDAFLPEALGVLSQARIATAAAQLASRGNSGLLKLGCVGGQSLRFLPPRLAEFRRRFRDVEITVLEMGYDRQVRALADGEIHIGIAIGGEPAAPPSLGERVILRSTLGLLAGASHRILRGRTVRLVDLEGEVILCQSNRHLQRVRALLAAAPQTKVGALKLIDGFPSLLLHIASGHGVAIMPKMSGDALPAGLAFRQFRAPIPDLSVEVRALWNLAESSRLRDNFLAVLNRTQPS